MAQDHMCAAAATGSKLTGAAGDGVLGTLKDVLRARNDKAAAGQEVSDCSMSQLDSCPQNRLQAWEAQQRPRAQNAAQWRLSCAVAAVGFCTQTQA